MNYHAALGQTLVGLSYAGRNPSLKEFNEGSPVEQRAIRKRWQEIFRTANPGSDDFRSAAINLQRSTPPLLLIDNKNPCDRDEGLESAQARFYRGENNGPLTSDDHGD